MKKIQLLFAVLSMSGANAQTIINKSYPVKEGQTIHLKFDYPQKIKITTWNKNEIAIQASVNINNGKNDSSFILQDTSDKTGLAISNRPFDFKTLPRSYTLTANSEIKIFDKEELLNEYIKSKGLKNCNIMSGNNMEVFLEIKVPANVFTNLKSTYGLVEMDHFMGPATIESIYGGIDASLSEKDLGVLSVSVNYGEIYSNLDLDITDKTDEAFHTAFKANYGSGASVSLESSYGNIYLRKAL